MNLGREDWDRGEGGVKAKRRVSEKKDKVCLKKMLANNVFHASPSFSNH